jgi:hypothetical protein
MAMTGGGEAGSATSFTVKAFGASWLNEWTGFRTSEIE